MSNLRPKNIQSHCTLVLIVATAMLCHATPAAAQGKPFKFELTPFAGYRVGGSFDEEGGDGRIELNDSNAQGIMFNIMANPNGQYELLYSRQSTDADNTGFLIDDATFDLDVETFHFGGTYLFDGDKTRPFLALTLGLTQFDPGIADSNSESFFSASIGGGIHLNASKRLGIRLEARAFTTFLEDDSNIFCVSSGGAGGCLIQVSGTALTQWEARAGLVLRF